MMTRGTVASVELHAVDRGAGAGESGHRLAALSLRRPWGRWLALLGLFVLVVVSVELDRWIRLDDSVDDWASSRRVTPLWNAAKTVFDVATPQVALPLTLALGVLAAWRRHRWSIVGEATIRVGLVVASVLLLKPLLAVPGPRDALGEHGGAFPSGHTTSTVVCVALLLAWLAWPRSMTGRVAVSAVVVAIVGWSVIYIHYHHFSDVVGGVVLGLLIATLPLPVFRRPGEAG
jgi:membrane-associated phospholipid phosphatase